MIGQEFINKIESYRLNAKSLLGGDGGHKIVRGMAHVISGYVEDLFALYLAENINDINNHYYVDKVISYRPTPNSKAKSFKPDLSIVNSSLLTHYFDLKTNMGWNRNFEDYLRHKDSFIETMKGRSAWVYWSPEKELIEISNDLKYQMIIVYGWNINQDLLRKNLERTRAFPNIKVHILCNQNKGTRKLEINEEAFEAILESVIS